MHCLRAISAIVAGRDKLSRDEELNHCTSLRFCCHTAAFSAGGA